MHLRHIRCTFEHRLYHDVKLTIVDHKLLVSFYGFLLSTHNTSNIPRRINTIKTSALTLTVTKNTRILNAYCNARVNTLIFPTF